MAPLPALGLFQTETLHSAWALPGKDAPDWPLPEMSASLDSLPDGDALDCLGCFTKTLLTAWARPDRGISLLGLSSRQMLQTAWALPDRDVLDCFGSSRQMCRTTLALPDRDVPDCFGSSKDSPDCLDSSKDTMDCLDSAKDDLDCLGSPRDVPAAWTLRQKILGLLGLL